MTKLLSLALAGLLATAAVASAQDGASAAMSEGMLFNDSDDSNQDGNGFVEFNRVDASGAGVIEVYDYRLAEMGALLGSQEVAAGTNWDVRVPVSAFRQSDVIAVLKIDGEVVDRRTVGEGM